MSLDRARVARILETARHREQGVLTEPEAMDLLDAAGIETPHRLLLRGPVEARRLLAPPFPGARVVIKVVAPHILHKTEVQGVRVVPNRLDEIVPAVDALAERFAGQPVDGFLMSEYVPYDPSLGHELLLGLRWTDDFGPVVTVGAGGVATEFLAQALKPGEAVAMLSPALADRAAVERALAPLAVVKLLTRGLRGRPPEVPLVTLAEVVLRFMELAEAFCPEPIGEFEVNPLVLSNGRVVALDALLRLAPPRAALAAPRPLAKVRRLLAPRSAAVMGVSEKLNPGRIILQNLLRDGFDHERIFVVKPGAETVDGCRCVPSIEALPERVDLIILSIAAAQVPAALAAIVEGQKAESVILIPGGLEEREGSEPIVAAMRDALARSRETPWGGPVVNGGNCLGIRSAPGRYNTLFIPEHKLPLPKRDPSPVALIAGSGAFAVSKTSKLAGVNPKYTISIGNQMDLTIGDYLEVLKDDPGIEVFAVYAEGFRPLDGLRLLKATRDITASGRTVILYRGGRTRAGAAAAASHTAAIAGDWLVTRQLAAAAGAVVAETLDDFEDLVRLFVRLRGRAVAGPRLGAVSNAGYESVAIADNAGALELAAYQPETAAGIRRVLERARLAGIVTVRNPIDLTPIMGDADTEEIVRLVLADPGVDVGIVGCVPLTGALNTLARGDGHADDVTCGDSLAQRLVRLWRASQKPWVAVVDGGRLYDRMADVLEDGGIPTFRTADRALRLLNVWITEARRQGPRVATTDPVGAGTA